MEVNLKVRIMDFPIPDAVRVDKESGIASPIVLDGDKISLTELSPEDLATLCDNFRSSIFARAGKIDPDTVAARKM